MNRCARIRSAGHGGQVLLSQITRKLVQDQTGPEVRIEDLGRHRLKDLLDAERIFQVSAPGLLQDFPPLKTLDLVRHNLPVQLSSFIGRENEIAEVREALFNKRLVTLAGTGGSGKTRLALQVAADTVDQYPDGVWFVDLVSVTYGKQIGQEIASQLKLPPESSEGVETQLEDWNALLILDNCEQIVGDAAKLVNRLLKTCPGLTILATSREPLSVAGEVVYKIPPLAYDLAGELASEETVSKLDAAKLLIERARDRGLEELLKDDSAAWIVRLCERLDGIPLALEQAAANLDVFTPKQLLAKLDHHFSMRGLKDEGVPDRHRTLEATVDWSYQMLSEKERLLFERLSIFVGGWSLDGARAVCQGDGILEREVDDLLGSLIRKSLVASSQTAWEDRRFRLLEVIREYALSKAETDTALEERHYAYFNGVVQESLIQLTGPNQALWAQLMEAEHENLRKAIRLAQDGNRSAEMAVGMRRFWMRMGFVREGLAALRFAVENEDVVEPETAAIAFNAMGAFAFKLEDLRSAQRYYEESFRLWDSLGRRAEQATVLHNLGGLAYQNGDPDLAWQCFDQSLLINKDSGNASAIASSQFSIGSMELRLGRLGDAERNLKAACSSFRNEGDSYNLAGALSWLADTGFQAGKAVEAPAHMAEALTIWQDVHDPYALGIALLCLSEYAADRGQPLEAALFASFVAHKFAEIGATLDDYLDRRQVKIWNSVEQQLKQNELNAARREAAHIVFDQVVSKALAFCKSIAS